MNLNVFPKAERKIEQARTWYEQQQQNLGERFSAAVRAKFITIERSPESFAIQFDDIRVAPVDGFPYLIFFCLTTDSIDVIGVLHTSRHPRRWKRL